MFRNLLSLRMFLVVVEFQMIILLLGIVYNANSKSVDDSLKDQKSQTSSIISTQSSELSKSKKELAEEDSSLFVLPFAAALTTSGSNNTGKPCNNSSDLDKCWSTLPPSVDLGIPSTPAAVDTACSAFDSGMNCVEEWAKQCLGKNAQDKVKDSVRGAHETYTFLCRDQKFRSEFLSHAACYKRISPLWDDCARRFIESLKRIEESNREPIAICCIRIHFLQCVTEVAHLHCTDDAAKFLQRMATTLVRSTIRTHVPGECRSVSIANCSDASGSCSTLKPSSSTFLLFPSLKMLISQYVTEIRSLFAYVISNSFINEYLVSFKLMSYWIAEKFYLNFFGFY